MMLLIACLCSFMWCEHRMDQLAALQMAVALLRMNIGPPASLYSTNSRQKQKSLWVTEKQIRYLSGCT